MKIYLILLFIILICSINNNHYEGYYTFFKPFEIKTKITYINKYIQDLYIFSTYTENLKFVTKLIKVLLTNTELINLKIQLPNKKISNRTYNMLNTLNRNDTQFSILPSPLLYSETGKYPNIRTLINISETTFYMIYNSYKYGTEESGLRNFVLDDITIFGTTEKDTLSYKITQIFLKEVNRYIPNSKIITDSFNNLINDLMDPKKDLNIVTFLDTNPSRKLQHIIDNDSENKIYLQELTLDLFNLNERYDYIYNEIYIKYEYPSVLYPNNEYKTISFNNTLITNNHVPDKIVLIIINFILEHRRFINNELKGYNISDFNELLPLYSFIPHRAIHKILNNLRPLDSIYNNM